MEVETLHEVRLLKANFKREGKKALEWLLGENNIWKDGRGSEARGVALEKLVTRLPPVNRFVLSLIKAGPSGMVCGLAAKSRESGLCSLPAGDLWADHLTSSSSVA